MLVASDYVVYYICPVWWWICINYVQVCLYLPIMVCIGGVVILMSPCMLSVAYCTMCHWANVYATVMCMYDMFLQIQ